MRPGVPNLLGHIDLQRLLLGDAVTRFEAGDRPTALADLEASWQLNRSLRDDPVLITQLIAMSNLRMQLGVLRQVGRLPLVWRDRLDEHDYRQSFLAGMQLDAWLPSQLTDAASWIQELGVLYALKDTLAKPYFELCAADISNAMRKRLDNLARLAVLCDTDLGERGTADLDITVPTWNKYGELLAPNLDDTIYRLARLEIDLELTAKLVELEAAREGNGGRWPESLPGIEDSRVLPGRQLDLRNGLERHQDDRVPSRAELAGAAAGSPPSDPVHGRLPSQLKPVG